MGISSNVQVVTITFTPVNRPPVGSVPPLITLQDTDLVSNIIATDLDGDAVIGYISSLPAKGQLKQYDGTSITTVPAQLTDSSLRFKFTPAPLESGNAYASFSFYLFDGTNYSSIVTASISVTFVDYPPIATSSVVPLLQGCLATSFTLQGSDIETPSIIAATILTLPPTSVGTLIDDLGNPLLVGSTVAAPRLISFTPLPQWYGITSFQFSVNDGGQNSTNVATVVLNVAHVNHAPTTTNFLSTSTAVRTVPLVVTIRGYDIDIGDNLTITIASVTGLGTFALPSGTLFPTAPFNLPTVLTIPAAGLSATTVTYIAPLMASGNNYASFTYYISDQTGVSTANTTVTINIAANQPPVAATLPQVIALQDTLSSSIVLSGTDADVADAASLRVIITSLPSKGALILANATTMTNAGVVSTASLATVTYLTFQRGSDQFTYQVQDALGALSLAVSVSIALISTNHPPVAQWLGACIGDEDTTISVTQMAGIDPDLGDTVSFYIAAPPSKGLLTQSDGTLCSSYPCLVTSSSRTMLFTPPTNGNGIPYTSFMFYTVDSHGLRSVLNATGIISVTAVDDPPVIANSTATGDENTNITVTLSVTDVDTPSALLTVTFISVPPASFGVIVDQLGIPVHSGDIRQLQVFTFVPVSYANGNSAIVYHASDVTSTSHPAVCLIVVVPVVQAPSCSVAIPSPIFVSKLSSTSINLLTHDPDSGETYTYYLLAFSLGDGSGNLTGPMGAINGSTGIFAAIQPPNSNTYVSSTSVTFNVSFVQNSLYMNFVVSDGTYNSSACAVSVIVAQNIAPAAIPPPPVTTLESTLSSLIILNGTDADDDWSTASISIVALPLHGQLFANSNPILFTGTLPQGVFGVTYLPAPLFHANDSFSFLITDETGVSSGVEGVFITVVHVNHLPTFSVGPLSTLEDVPLSITTISISDIDIGDILHLVLTSGPSQGSFIKLDGTPISSYPATLSAPFAFSFVPAQYSNGVFTFSFYATDGASNTAPSTASISVIAVNYPPTLANSSVSLLENAPATSFAISMTDVDNAQMELYACVLTLPSSSLGIVKYTNGSAVVYGDCVAYPHTVTFTPAQYAHGTGALTFLAHDSSLFSSAVGMVSFAVEHVNHAPTVSAASSVLVTRSVELAIPMLASDVDVADLVSIKLLSMNGGSGVLSNSSSGPAIALNAAFFSSCIISTHSPLYPCYRLCFLHFFQKLIFDPHKLSLHSVQP